MIIVRDNDTWIYTVEWPDGRRQQLASVTTIIDAALGQFQGFDLAQLTEMFRAGERTQAITGGVVALMDRVRNAGDFGRAVHTMTELDDVQELDEDSLDPALVPVLLAWRNFKAEHALNIICTETAIGSRLGYAGTLDRVAVIDGKKAILEIKSRAYKKGRDELQTIAYQKAYEEMTGEKIAGRYVIELKLNGTYTLTKNTDRRDWDIFRAMLAVYHWRLNHG